MRSTFAGLNTLTRGLYANQVSLDTVGHNISNAGTQGYSRQMVNLSTTKPQTVFGGYASYEVGTGVNVSSILRARDTFVDRQYWKESSSLGYGQTMEDILGKIEGVFAEPTDTGIQTVLNKFWSAWQTLAVNASDSGARTAVRERGVEVVDAIQHSAQQLTDMVADINAVLDIRVNNINQISSELYSLNKQISNIESGGLNHANDLRDRRDVLIDELTKITSANVTEDKYGNYNVQVNGVMLVDGNGYQKLATTKTMDTDYGYEVKNVVIAGSTQPVTFTNGEMKGLLDARDSSEFGAKGYLDKLSTMSKFLLQEFNEVHRGGYGTDNSTNNNFFGDGGATDPDYNSAFSAGFTDGDWIKVLKVNPDLFNTTNGLAKIAAKTSQNSLAVVQSNASGGTASVSTTGSYTGGSTPTNVSVRISTDASQNVSSIQYSTDGGTTWSAAIAGAAPYPSTYSINIKGLTVNMQINTAAANVNGDTYQFSLSSGNNASGDNAVLLSNRLKVDTSLSLGGASLDTYYSSMTGALGVQKQNASRLADNQQVLVNTIMNWRESTAGVNMDEEMTNMIRFQQGYNAAARIITTMDEMLDKLINGTGVTGR
ncbi:flagellar hook-associated protein FlgK [Dendrosporobacter sp. 1207_IL3150]|uniref:flagellar hook-associated protein FlgK n=1 Tax=Dendrosporobacter sp. 1207_IL3150 TaxID=3084054 RepID=UPI002FDB4D24